MSQRKKRGPSQRQLRVGELLRHALSEILARGDIREPALEKTAVTVLEVAASPDLRNATAYVMPLGGENADAVLEALDRSSRYIRGQLSRAVDLKYMPRLSFRLDSSFDYSANVDRLLNDPRVRRDIESGDDDTGAPSPDGTD